MIDSLRPTALLIILGMLAGGAAWAQQDAPAADRPTPEELAERRRQSGVEQAPTPLPGVTLEPPPGPTPEALAEAGQRRDEAGTDLATLIERVAASTGKQFLIDPRVRARAYNVPPIEDPTYDTLLSILRIHGYMAIEVGGRINVLPTAIARSMPVRLLQQDDPNVPDDEWVTRIVTVRNGNAAQLVPILRPLMPQAAHMAATADGKLVLVDTYANVRRITEVIDALTR